MKLLRNAISEGFFILDLKAYDLKDIFHHALNLVVSRELISAEHREQIELGLVEREEEYSTAIGSAVAVPHIYSNVFKQRQILFIRLDRALNLGAPDGLPTRFLILMFGPEGQGSEHLDSLMHIARTMSDDVFRYEAATAKSKEDLLAALDRFAARNYRGAKPVTKETPESLRYTGRIGGGLMLDVKRRWADYASDFTDGFHSKSISSTLFLLFACLAPAVTFGGVMAELTNDQIGPVEMIAGSAICGVIYALFAGQPLIILGGTGPLLIFTWFLYELCARIEAPFLETRAWVGLWTGLFLLILAFTDASCLIRFFTRFTDEIFAALISIIFIYEAIRALVRTITEDFSDGDASHDKGLFSLILAIGTFYIAMTLSSARRSRYLFPQMREFLADFGPSIALGAMTLTALFLQNIPFDILPAQDSFRPTADRSWLLDLSLPPFWVCVASAGPAILVTILVYLDQNITARLVNNRDHKLQKGEAYHLDLAVVGVLIALCSLVGLPWLVAATVRSLNHVRSLAKLEEVVGHDGSSHSKIIHVRETRVTGLAIHLLIGLSLFLLPMLAIPMAVLYGIFLFMGVISMSGNQFFERVGLWPMDPARYPSTHYMRRVPTLEIHKFTLLQAVCLVVLWLVKASSLAILFPLVIALLVPVRLFAARLFKPEHLESLDAEEEPEEEETRWD